LYQAAPIERIEQIKRGVGARQVFALAEQLDTTQDRLMQHLGLPRATMVRKSRARQNLSTEQAERVVGLAKIIGQVQTMVQESGNPEGFVAAHWVGQWLERPNSALGGRRPADLMDTVAGQELVGGVLAKMQSGAYA
jgi:putative toxin-antitoxin system antitoxin component (TIGR02293 family)